jgi:hypothetical protein
LMLLKMILTLMALAAISMPAIAGGPMTPIQLSGSSSHPATDLPFSWTPSGQKVLIPPAEAMPIYSLPWSISSRTGEPIYLSGSKFYDSRYFFIPGGWGRSLGGGDGASSVRVGWLALI